MTVQKIIPEDKNTNKNEEMNYDVWIDVNMKNICNKGRDRIEYISTKNRPTNKDETQKLIDELIKLDLAYANALSATLTRKGEEVCKAGGWIEYLRIETERKNLQINSQKGKDNLELEFKQLQVESLKYQKTIRERDNKIAELDLKLKKWKIWGFRWWITGIAFSTLTFLLSHLREIQTILSQLWKLVSKQ